MTEKHFLACDLGAESGRVMLGTLAGGALSIEELHRFPNEPVQLPGGLYWDTLRLFHEIVKGIAAAGRGRKLSIDGIGVDTWGVDFALLGADGALCDNPRHYRDARNNGDGALCDNPRHYRDARNNGIVERMCQAIPRDQIFAATGIQFMQINSLCQLYAMKLAGAPALRSAGTLLFMPDLFNYWLTGVKKAELTIASTSQFYDPRKKHWAAVLFDKLELPAAILPAIVEPGTQLGPLLPHIAERTGVDAPVYASAGHDTAAAVAAVPAQGDDWCYISSGTWSLMGVELPQPLINDDSLRLNFTNEAGFGGTTRLLKNIAGLWLIQECRRQWAIEGTEYTYEELTQMAEAAPSYNGYIDPDAFLEPGHMPAQIEEYCRRHEQPIPLGPAETIRALLQSLAKRYKEVLTSLESLTNKRLNTIHIVGGGSRNRLLNQLVADVTGRRVAAGPIEATAIGNVLVQAIGSGAIAGLPQARQIVARSFPVDVYNPTLY